MTELELLEELKRIDTPTVTNVVATYPGNELCLELYHPWEANWYTDNRLGCWYPELGPVAGYAVTCTYGVTDPGYSGPTLMDVLEEADKLGKPSIFCFEQRFPPELADKVGLAGGNMTSALKGVRRGGCGEQRTLARHPRDPADAVPVPDPRHLCRPRPAGAAGGAGAGQPVRHGTWRRVTSCTWTRTAR